MRHGKWVIMAAVGLSGWMVALGLATVNAASEPVFEMRTYYPAAGKTEAMHARFRDHADRLFRKHGIKPLGYWVPVDAEKDGDKLVYILQHESKEAADASWAAFRADEDWVNAKAESEKDGKLVEKSEVLFLKATDYSGRE